MITCPRQGYCGWCHWWTSDTFLGAPEVIAELEAQGGITPLPVAERSSRFRSRLLRRAHATP